MVEVKARVVRRLKEETLKIDLISGARGEVKERWLVEVSKEGTMEG